MLLSDRRRTPEQAGRGLLILLAAALVLRFGMVLVFPENLTDDRDIYLSLAEGLRDHRGYSMPGSEQPTAFRPPLYPLLLAAATGVSDIGGIAGLNLLLGSGTVGLSFALALRLGLSTRFALLAGAIVAVDPLLLLYVTFPMTETLCAFLAAGLLLAVCRLLEDEPVSLWRAAGVGLLFGLCVLSRPTFWVFSGVMAVRLLWRMRRGDCEAWSWKPAAVTLATAALVVAAWPIRNFSVLGSPILTTTHGGYTLLLGNNPAFYEEVVRQPWGTVWDGTHGPGQQVWVQRVNHEMDQAGVIGEVARDRWMSVRARSNIREEPDTFLRACLLRFVRFWNIVPSGPAADGIPRPMLWLLGGGYVLLFAAALFGVLVVLRDRRGVSIPAVLLVVSFTLVHLVYWSNARMRAPVMPAVAVLAAAGVAELRLKKHVIGKSAS